MTTRAAMNVDDTMMLFMADDCWQSLQGACHSELVGVLSLVYR